MSGHSKWSTIKRKKGALDAKRGKRCSRVELSPSDGNPRERAQEAFADRMREKRFARIAPRGDDSPAGDDHERRRSHGFHSLSDLGEITTRPAQRFRAQG